VSGERAHIGDRVEFTEFRNNVPFFSKTGFSKTGFSKTGSTKS
jgi:hypothetical protein